MMFQVALQQRISLALLRIRTQRGQAGSSRIRTRNMVSFRYVEVLDRKMFLNKSIHMFIKIKSPLRMLFQFSTKKKIEKFHGP